MRLLVPQLVFLLLVYLCQVLDLVLQELNVPFQSLITRNTLILALVHVQLPFKLFVLLSEILQSVFHVSLLQAHSLQFLDQRSFPVNKEQLECEIRAANF